METDREKFSFRDGALVYHRLVLVRWCLYLAPFAHSVLQVVVAQEPL